MSEELKYIKTSEEQIVIFPMEIEHSTFKFLNPTTAGFCRIRTNRSYEGESERIISRLGKV